MSKPEKTTVFFADWQTLFNYEQDDSRTSIKISSRQTNFTRRVHHKDIKGSSISRHVRFKLCGLDLSDSFEALSIALALVKVFEHRQFGIGDKNMVIPYPTSNDPDLRLFCALQPYKESYEGLRIGWMAGRNGRIVQKEHVMNIGYVHHFRNGLHRAMSWLSPQAIIEQMELPEIKFEPWKDSDSRNGRGYY